jgi:hypothetical protein
MIEDWQTAIGPLFFWFEKRSASDLLFFAVHDEDIVSEEWLPAFSTDSTEDTE